MRNTKHLYIHIPFCKQICTYCDFCRISIKQDDVQIEKYIDLVISNVISSSHAQQYTTIYIGGGTPNYLTNTSLIKLLESLVPFLNTTKDYEFCIECNPEFLTLEQAMIFGDHKINRVSMGVQTTNNQILKQLQRQHTIEDAITAIENLQAANIYNISCDFIYALDNLNISDLEDAVSFAVNYKIKHLSFYALEIKEGSILAANHFQIDEEQEGLQLEYIDELLNTNGFQRYEVGNWAIEPKYQSMHNKAYWLSNDWKAVGYGASGFENMQLYKYEGNLLNWKLQSEKLTTHDFYLQIFMMGLRLTEGIEIVKNKRNANAYAYFFNELTNCYVRNNHLIVKNLNLLHETLLNIVDETKEQQLKNSANNN